MLTELDSLLVTLDPSEKPVTLGHDGRRYGLLPGVAVHVPFELVRRKFGDPRSGASAVTARTEDGKGKIQIRSRADELKRLEIRYGVAGENLRRQMEATQANKVFKPVRLSDVAPKVTVTTVTGEPVTTVVADPSGNAPAPISIAADDTEALNSRVAQMQRDLDTLMAQQRAQSQQGDGSGEGASEDTPGNAAGSAA